jgi:ABC-type phosphate/phosphonate transport system substrate-binding protein
LLVFPSPADQHAVTMTSTRLVANARMYSVTPETARAWHRLFDWLAATSGAALDVIEHAYPARLPDLWARPDLGAAFVCGWPYASRLRDLQIVAAPIPRLERAGGRAVYWTDMVVKADRPHRKLEDTFGGRIAFTSKDSHSGFNAVRRLLMQHASSRPDALYSSAIGPLVTPRRSLESVLSGDADVAPVDAYAHALLQRHCPELTAGVRTIAMTDVTPIPLLVASAATDSAPIARMRAALVGAGQNPTARGLLDDLVLEGFAEVEPGDYDVTQSWARDAERAGWFGLAAREQAPAAD